MKPHVLCHAAISLDGRTLLSRWHPQDAVPEGIFEQVYADMAADGWIVGRKTGDEYAKGDQYPETHELFPREHRVADRRGRTWAIVLDPRGSIVWGRDTLEGDPLLVVLTEQVSDSHLAGLRSEGISYVFAGKGELDLPLLLEILHEAAGVQRVRVEGGGTTNALFLAAGLIDELSLLLVPAVDGRSGAPSLFEDPDGEAPAHFSKMHLEQCRPLEGGLLHLRYTITN